MVVDVVKHVGDDVVIIATDYPHSDAVDKFPDHTIGDLTGAEHSRRKPSENPLGQPRSALWHHGRSCIGGGD